MLASPRSRRVVLVGGGHAHVEVLRRAAMRRLPDAELVLVTDRVHSAYSGMVPALIAGTIDRNDLEIDVWPLARRAGATVIRARMTGIDAEARVLHLEGRPSIGFDLCSLDIGGSVAGLDTPGVREHAVATRPLAVLLDRIESLPSEGPSTITVVGGGAAGVELALALRTRVPTASVTLLDRGPHVLASASSMLRRQALRALSERQVRVMTGLAVARVTAEAVECADGTVLPSDLTVWATGAAPHPELAETGLPTGRRGFLRIADDLRVVGHEHVFAVGDCAVPDSRPDLPRAGVYSVRMGPVLHNNLVAVLKGRPTEAYRPQRSMLSLLNVCDGTAIAGKFGIAVRSKRMARWKDHIDRSWLDRYRGDGLPEMPPMPMQCSGCAAKVPATVLGQVVGDTVAGDAGEDAARIDAPGPLAWTVDAFPAFSLDGYLVARVAAVHALSDLWCKGVRPSHALALICAPEEAPAGLEVELTALQRGLTTVLQAHGIALAGGHTMTAQEVSVGLTAIGPAETYWPLHAARAGDVLVLTRALGTGIALRADAMGLLSGRDMLAVLDSMLAADAPVAELPGGVSAATDVSGFGLAHHLLDLCRASGVGAELDVTALPILPGVAKALAAGIRSTSAPTNEAAVQDALELPEHPCRPLMFDPQTGGGILLCVAESAVADVIARTRGTRIGRLTQHAGGPRVRGLGLG